VEISIYLLFGEKESSYKTTPLEKQVWEKQRIYTSQSSLLLHVTIERES